MYIAVGTALLCFPSPKVPVIVSGWPDMRLMHDLQIGEAIAYLRIAVHGMGVSVWLLPRRPLQMKPGRIHKS
jgi:hypothetical protein